MQETNNPFPGIDGLFNDPKLPEVKAVSEAQFLEPLIRGFPISPNDVIGVGFASTHQLQGNKILALYLTERGMREREDADLGPRYAKLTSQVHGGARSLAEGIRKGWLNDPLKAEGQQRQITSLGGPDGISRYVVFYTRETTNQKLSN